MKKEQLAWLEAIKKDIKQKYNISDPEFLVDEEKLEQQAFEEWLKKYINPRWYWMKYTIIKDNAFELKPFSPDPDDIISRKLIDEYLASLPKSNKTTWYTVTYVDDDENETIEGDSWYDEKEIKTELLFLFRIGKSKISFLKNPTETKTEIVYNLFIEKDSLENMLKSGYLKLES